MKTMKTIKNQFIPKFMKTLSLCFVFGWLIGTPNLFAQKSSIPGAFVDVGLGARPVAMGSAYSGLADDINALFWNPAGLTNLKEKQASFTTAKIFGLITYNMVSVGMPIPSDGPKQGAGLALIYSGDEMLREMTITAGFGREVGPVTLGANLKYRYASFGNNGFNEADYNFIFSQEEIDLGKSNQVRGSANGFGIDLGLLYQFDSTLRFGLMLRDLVAPVMWNSQSDSKLAKGKYTESVPFESVIGTSYKISNEFTMTADLKPAFTKDVSTTIRGGAELRLFKFLFVRAGLQNSVNSENDEKYVFGFGFNYGIKKSTLKFDYTYLSEQLASSNRLTLSFTF